MSDGFTVEPPTLRTHAAHVAEVETAVGRATPGERMLSSECYGVVGQVFAATATSAMATGTAAVEEARRALVGLSGALTTAAAEYENADLRAAQMFGGDR